MWCFGNQGTQRYNTLHLMSSLPSTNVQFEFTMFLQHLNLVNVLYFSRKSNFQTDNIVHSKYLATEQMPGKSWVCWQGPTDMNTYHTWRTCWDPSLVLKGDSQLHPPDLRTLLPDDAILLPVEYNNHVQITINDTVYKNTKSVHKN